MALSSSQANKIRPNLEGHWISVELGATSLLPHRYANMTTGPRVTEI